MDWMGHKALMGDSGRGMKWRRYLCRRSRTLQDSLTATARRTVEKMPSSSLALCSIPCSHGLKGETISGGGGGARSHGNLVWEKYMGHPSWSEHNSLSSIRKDSLLQNSKDFLAMFTFLVRSQCSPYVCHISRILTSALCHAPSQVPEAALKPHFQF